MTEYIIRANKAQSILGLPKSSFYAQIANGLLLSSIRMGKRSVGWLESEITAILRARIQNKSDNEIRSLVQKMLLNQRKETCNE